MVWFGTTWVMTPYMLVLFVLALQLQLHGVLTVQVMLVLTICCWCLLAGNAAAGIARFLLVLMSVWRRKFTATKLR